MDEEGFIPEEDWKTIVGNVPVVTVDLLIQCKELIPLGKR